MTSFLEEELEDGGEEGCGVRGRDGVIGGYGVGDQGGGDFPLREDEDQEVGDGGNS